jgi:alkylation response protein AidB-like acyl-CoA dehydrogenase
LIIGTEGMLTRSGSPRDGIVAEILVSVPAVSIVGGTDEIQRNIIVARVLELPKRTVRSELWE